MTRKECLEAAMGCVLKDRASEYGGVEDNFRVIANFWSVYLGKKVSPADVACMMALLKIARAKSNPAHGDSWTDIAGYAACGAECAQTPAPKKAEGCGEPKESHDLFPSGTPIEVKWGAHWVPAKYMNGDSLGFHNVRMQSGAWELVGAKMIRPVKAEGCEALVEKAGEECGR